MKIEKQDVQNFLDREKVFGIRTTMVNIHGLKDVLESWVYKLDDMDYRLANQDLRNFIEHLWTVYRGGKIYYPKWQMTTPEKVMEYVQYLRTSGTKVYAEDRTLLFDLMSYFAHYYKDYIKEIQR